jgi:UPF0716 protein FxsA
MAILALIAFIGVPLLEIAVFIQLGGWIGLWPTLALVVLSAMLGTWQLRAQGLATLARARAAIDAGQVPTLEIFDGACLLVAGALLLTPGFVTDTLGLLLFVPAVRAYLRTLLGRHLRASVATGVFIDGEDAGGHRPRGRVIDGDYRDVSGPPPVASGREPPR